MEVGARVEHFLSKVFNYFYIVIWSYMKLEDVLEIFPCSFFKISWSNLFSFGDINNAPRCLLKFHLGPIII
jgi:hypothetical protein